MFKKALRVIGEGAADVIEGVVQDLVHGKKARRGRNGAFKVRKTRKPRQRRTYARHTTRTIVVYNYGTLNVGR